jgi:phage tail-like protein
MPVRLAQAFANTSYYSVEIENEEIGRFSECTGLSVRYETYSYNEGGQQGFVHEFRGHRTYPHLTLKKGITNENKFLDWLLRNQKREERGTVTVKLLNAEQQPVRTWAFSRAVPIAWEGPTLTAGSASVANETLTIAHEGLVI